VPPPGTLAAPALTTCAWCGAVATHASTNRTLCSVCGVATTRPWPSDVELAEAYGEWYRPDAGRFAGPGDGILRLSRGALARRLDRIAPPGPVLDVGAGDGALLDALRQRGREAVGLERVRMRDDVRETQIVDFDERRGEWASVVFWHSLEHLRDPGAALERAAALLRPGGALVVALPNAGSWQASLFGDRWFALDIPRHLVHVPTDALVRRISGAGLIPRRVNTWRGGQVAFGWLHGLIGKMPGHPDLYDAIRRPEARQAPMSERRRLATLAAAVASLAPAIALACVEVAGGRGGTVYVEAHRP